MTRASSELVRSVAVLDDEPPARQRLVDLLARRDDVRLVAEWASGKQALAEIGHVRPEVLFLDVQMPGLDGFDVLAQWPIGHPMPFVVFVTAYEAYALRAFEVHAVDYLLKPFSDDRFTNALDRALEASASREHATLTRRLLQHLGRAAEPAGHERPHRLLVRDGARVVFVDANRIDYLEGAGVYVEIHLGQETLLHRETLATLESQLDPTRFVRIHRSTIVNLDRVKELHPHTHGEFFVVLEDGTTLKLSRGFRAHVEARLRQRL